jgi:hypothetical protein
LVYIGGREALAEIGPGRNLMDSRRPRVGSPILLPRGILAAMVCHAVVFVPLLGLLDMHRALLLLGDGGAVSGELSAIANFVSEPLVVGPVIPGRLSEEYVEAWIPDDGPLHGGECILRSGSSNEVPGKSDAEWRLRPDHFLD